MDERAGGGCASEATIAAFFEKRLDSAERRRLIEHIAVCAKCRDLVLASTEMQSSPPAAPKAERRVWPWWMAAVIAVAALTAAIAPRLRQKEPPSKTGIPALVEASAQLPHRLIEGRLSGGFAFRPWPEPHRGPQQSSGAAGVEAAAARIRGEAPKGHAAGVAALLEGEHDAAVAILENEARRNERDALLWSDLSAAYHARGAARQYVPDRIAALDAAERAWRLRKTPEAAWNRAVAVSALAIVASARRAWDDFLATDSDPQWRQEAVRRRNALDVETESAQWARVEPLFRQGSASHTRDREDAIRRFPARAFAHFDATLLPQWAEAQLRRDATTATARRQIATAVAATLASMDERLPLDAMAAIDSACRETAACDALARAHVRYAEGVVLFDAQQIARAAPIFDETRRTFESAGSPYALFARFHRGACMLHENRFREAGESGAALLEAVGHRPYRKLRGRALWLAGLVALHQARPEESILHYRAARDLFAQARDVTNTASIELMLADASEYAGDRDVAMAHRLACLHAMHRGGDLKQLGLALFEAGTSAAMRKRELAADYLLAEAAREAVSAGRFAIAALASMWRSMLAAHRDDFAVAGEQARLASLYSNRTTDPGQRALVEASANQLGMTARPAEETAALRLTETIQFFDNAGNRAWLPQLLRQRALLHESDGDLAAAEADFRQAIEVAEEVLDRSAPATMRDGFASDTRATYERLIGLLVARGASREALAFAERARRLGGGPQRESNVLRAIDAIPSSTAAAVLEVQPEAVLVWLITRGSVRLIRIEASPALIAGLAATPQDAPSESVRASLYDLLVRRWIEQVPRGARLAILPPPQLSGVAFGALLHRESGRSVIDDHAVILAPTLESLAGNPVTVERSDRILIVGDPAYRSLSRLTASRGEALEIARQYLDPAILLGEEATGASVLSRMPAASIFHFGGHAVANDLAPELSSLMLAPNDGGEDDSRIYVHELLRQRLEMKLVVLAACSSARSRSGDARGTLSIARAFLDGGARAVVGTQWPVSDAEAAAFSAALHEALLRGEEVAEATRAAQLHVRAMNPEASTWAAFCVLQGGAVRKEKED